MMMNLGGKWFFSMPPITGAETAPTHCARQQGERTQQCAGGEDHDGHDEQCFGGELAHHERRARDRYRQQQQVACGEPLHHRGADGEFFHQGGVGDVQRRFRQDTEEGQDRE